MTFKVKRKKPREKKTFAVENEEEVKMGIYDKQTRQLVDFGVYKSVSEARKDFFSFDKPRGRFAIIESSEGVEKLK
jgi:hypothetical protein